MRRTGIAVWVLLVITLAGLPAGVHAEGAYDGLVAIYLRRKEHEKNCISR